jgi:hypothetical protein
MSRPNKCKMVAKKIINHWAVVLFMTLATLYALFFNDIKVLCLDKSSDNIESSITTFVFICFFLEIVINCISDYHYIGSFFFWLDLTSTISLVFDIGWVVSSLDRSK